MKTAVLFILFNRPDTTQLVFDEIRKAKPAKLFIAADGPRPNREDDAQKCEEARKIVEQIDWPCEVKTLFRPENLGCKMAVSSAIDWFFEHVEEGIILEDDCLPSPSFFYFCENMLDYHRHEQSVMHVSGVNPLNTGFGEGSYYFTRIPHIWGWATWRRAWKRYDVHMSSYPDFVNQNRISDIFTEKEYQQYWLKIFQMAFEGQIDTWDYQWVYTLFNHHGLSIIPSQNLISNIGFDGNATHTLNHNSPLANRPVYTITTIHHPTAIIPSKTALKQVMKEWFGVVERTPLFVLKREITRSFKKLVGLTS
jgi:hypothetical protein